jgi:SSS family solute:Na+ symporter
MFAQDIYRNRIKKAATDAQVLAASRIAIFVVAVLALVISLAGMESLILKWSFLSMGLRGSTVFFPLMGAVFLPRCIERRAGVLAVALAPLCSLVWGVLNPSGLDPLYIGLTTSVLVLGAGRVLGRSVAPQVRQAPGGR